MRNYKTKYKQTALYLLLLIGVFAVMGMTRRCNTALPLPALNKGESKGDTLDVAIVYGPLSYYLYGDTLGGLNYDLINRMSEETGRPVKLWPVTDLNEALEALQKNKFDMLASMPADAGVKEKFLTTKSVFLDRMVLIQLQDSLGETTVKSPLDLGADTVFIEKGSPAALRLSNLSDETANPIPVKEVSLSEEYLCMKVALGEFPLAVVNEKTAKKMKNQYPQLSYDNPVSFSQFQVWLIPRNDSILLTETDRWLDSCLKTDHYKELLNLYTGNPSN